MTEKMDSSQESRYICNRCLKQANLAQAGPWILLYRFELLEAILQSR